MMLRNKPFLALAIIACCLFRYSFASEPIRIGVSAAKSGPLSEGAALTHFPNIRLWAKNVNANGGIQVGQHKRSVKLIELDDQSSNAQAVKNVMLLEKKYQAHFILAPYGTSINLSVAPTFARYGHPQLISTAITDRAKQLSRLWPTAFWLSGQSSSMVQALTQQLSVLRQAGHINRKVALIAVQNPFGIELRKVAMRQLRAAGFEVTLNALYPQSLQDFSSLLAQARGSDSFLAFSYATDTFKVTRQAIAQKLSSRVFYTGIDTPTPAYQSGFGEAIEGVLSLGGVSPDEHAMRRYRHAFEAANQHHQAPDYWNSAVIYSGLQVLTQAIERAQTLNRESVVKQITSGRFNTVVGEFVFVDNLSESYWTLGQWQNGAFHAIQAKGDRPVKREYQRKAPW